MKNRRKFVGDRIRAYREACGWSLIQLADGAKVNPGTLSRAERGLTDLRTNTLCAVAEALGVPVSALASEEVPDAAVAELEVFKFLSPRNRQEVLDYAWFKLMRQRQSAEEQVAAAGGGTNHDPIAGRADGQPARKFAALRRRVEKAQVLLALTDPGDYRRERDFRVVCFQEG